MSDWQELTDSQRIEALLHLVADLSRITDELVDRILYLESTDNDQFTAN